MMMVYTDKDKNYVEDQINKNEYFIRKLLEFRFELKEAFEKNFQIDFFRAKLNEINCGELEQVFFPVELKEIYINFGKKIYASKNCTHNQVESESQRKDADVQLEKLERFFAVTDTEKDYVFAVVTKNYHLVHNLEAVLIGFTILEKLFEMVSPDDLHLKKVKLTSTRSACMIDFTSKEVVDRSQSSEGWFPFLRVINSYNRTHQLRFELGFGHFKYRKFDIILGKKSINVSTPHTKDSTIKIENFIESIGDIKALELEIAEKTFNLKRFYISRQNFLPLLFKVFDLKKIVHSTDKAAVSTLFDNVQALTERFTEEYGPTGYAALNVLCAFAFEPIGLAGIASRSQKFQERTWDWMVDFCELISDRDFRIDEYLKGMPRTHADLLKICE